MVSIRLQLIINITFRICPMPCRCGPQISSRPPRIKKDRGHLVRSRSTSCEVWKISFKECSKKISKKINIMVFSMYMIITHSPTSSSIWKTKQKQPNNKSHQWVLQFRLSTRVHCVEDKRERTDGAEGVTVLLGEWQYRCVIGSLTLVLSSSQNLLVRQRADPVEAQMQRPRQNADSQHEVSATHSIGRLHGSRLVA